MPTFDADAVRRLADLTKIGLAEGEAETLAGALTGAAAGWDDVAAENLDDVAAWTQRARSAPWRKDIVGAMFTPEEAVSLAGRAGDNQFLVPEIL